MKAYMNTRGFIFHICYMSSKVFLNKPYIKTMKTISMWLLYILKQLCNLLEV